MSVTSEIPSIDPGLKPKPPQKPAKKRPYNRVLPRTTPVGRAGRNLKRARNILASTLSRVSAWLRSGRGAMAPKVEKTLAGLESGISEAMETLEILEGTTRELDEMGFAPLDASKVPFKEGDRVKVAERYMKKYLEAYSASSLESLVVKKAEISDSIEVLVGNSRGQFLISRRQLERR